ncbi:MAG: alpha/beta fold hydrolase [Trebonia sp.]
MRASSYLGDLGGLSAHRRLVLPDLRGTGSSAVPADPASYRCDALVDDVVALLDHLGLDQADLLAHSAGAGIAVQFAARHPERVRRLALITPGGQAVGLVRSRDGLRGRTRPALAVSDRGGVRAAVPGRPVRRAGGGRALSVAR